MANEQEAVEGRIKLLERKLRTLQSQRDRARNLAAAWHGKFSIVKTENKTLRRKIWNLKNGGREEEQEKKAA